MTDQPKPLQTVTHILQSLHKEPAPRTQPASAQPLEGPLASLRLWQSERLARTYADLLADPRHAPACRFFLSDIYAPQDFSRRDQDAENLYSWLARFLPPPMLVLLHDAISLNRLTYALDEALVDVLVNRLAFAGPLTAELYAEGYRLCANYAERVRQIEMLVNVSRQVGEGTHLPLVGVTLRLARKPAYDAGWGELYAFLARGYTAFKHMGSPDHFIATIQTRETQILDRIYACHLDPFGVQELGS